MTVAKHVTLNFLDVERSNLNRAKYTTLNFTDVERSNLSWAKLVLFCYVDYYHFVCSFIATLNTMLTPRCRIESKIRQYFIQQLQDTYENIFLRTIILYLIFKYNTASKILFITLPMVVIHVVLMFTHSCVGTKNKN